MAEHQVNTYKLVGPVGSYPMICPNVHFFDTGELNWRTEINDPEVKLRHHQKDIYCVFCCEYELSCKHVKTKILA